MAPKTHPEKVNPNWARLAIKSAKDSHALYSNYVLWSYRTTGNLASGCDARDLIAWYQINMPDELTAITKTRK